MWRNGGIMIRRENPEKLKENLALSTTNLT
jgi:hypothetical protein